MNQATMSFPSHQVMGEGGNNEPTVTAPEEVQTMINSEGSALDLSAVVSAEPERNVIGAVAAPELDLYNREAVRIKLLSVTDEGEPFFGNTFIDALEDDEKRTLVSRLRAAERADATTSDTNRFCDYICELESVTGIDYNGTLNSYGTKALSLLRDDEIVTDAEEMRQRIRFLLKHGFDWPVGERPPVDRVEVNPTFADKNGFDRFMFVTDCYYDPLNFGVDERTGKVHGYYDDGDNKFWSSYTWNPTMSSFCTREAECRCFVCNAYTRCPETRTPISESLRARFRLKVMSAASHKWSRLRAWSTANRTNGERNHVLFGFHADVWLQHHDNRDRVDKEDSFEFEQQNNTHMYYAGGFVRIPQFTRRRTITVRNAPRDIALYEIRSIIGQATGVISVRRSTGTDVEVVVPNIFGFRRYHQVLNVLTGSPVVIRRHTLEFVPDAQHQAPAQAPQPAHPVQGGDWVNVNGHRRGDHGGRQGGGHGGRQGGGYGGRQGGGRAPQRR